LQPEASDSASDHGHVRLGADSDRGCLDSAPTRAEHLRLGEVRRCRATSAGPGAGHLPGPCRGTCPGGAEPRLGGCRRAVAPPSRRQPGSLRLHLAADRASPNRRRAPPTRPESAIRLGTVGRESSKCEGAVAHVGVVAVDIRLGPPLQATRMPVQLTRRADSAPIPASPRPGPRGPARRCRGRGSGPVQFGARVGTAHRPSRTPPVVHESP
jgi:hypothetical protein